MLPKTAFLAVSLFKPELDGDLLRSHLTLLDGDDRFDNVIIALGDTLYEHNLNPMIDDLAERIALARGYGQEWLARNDAAISDVSKPCGVLRFEMQKREPDFWSVWLGIAQLFKAGPFRKALACDVAEFITRAKARGMNGSASDSADYILEELAADIAAARVQPFTHIYPGHPLKSYLAMIDHARDVPEGLCGLEMCSFLRTRADASRGTVRFAGTPYNEQPDPFEPAGSMAGRATRFAAGL